MDLGNIGKWLWIVGLALALIWGLAGALGMGLPEILATVAQAAAFLGGLLHLSSMKDKTAFYIAALALGAFAGGAGSLFVDILGGIVAGLLGGAAVAAAAGAAGMLLKTVYEWVMP
ncbi:MAG: hypothetical protein KF821_09415 [Anaerolineales bacterium]|nr:hypothetical protein [Anaerolineales bacterium]MBX3006026.1 hypothetical protein [Anaerolineales bacterium]MCW5838989.1 hypothetical protein [Anaerolineales bacterium]MCW5888431.1 hypothetical protein [Anaerolineales bacterium]